MAATIDWTAFTAFGGTLRRETLGLDPDEPTHPNDATIQRDITQFNTWMTTLHNTNNLQPIFGIYAADARNVLSAFFLPNRPALRVRDDPDPAGTQERVARPLPVQWGRLGEYLDLVDGPSALAYLFSIATPPDDATWQDYFLPMLVLLCKCLYLAFIDAPANGAFGMRVTGVPMMSCLMYTDRGNRDYSRYAFGSTFITGTGSIAFDQDKRAQRQKLLDKWRRELMNRTLYPEPAPLLPNIPDHPFHLFCPGFLGELATNLYNRLGANVAYQAAANIAFAAIQGIQLPIVGPNAEPIPRRQIWNIVTPANHYPSLMKTALITLIKDRVDISYEPNPANLLLKARAYVELAIVPKLLQRRPGNQGPLLVGQPIPEPATPQYLPAKAGFLATFWAVAGVEIQRELDTLAGDVSMQNLLPTGPGWGRCAETYCFTGILPRYWPQQDLAPMSAVKGVAMEPRAIGPSYLQPFSTLTTGQTPGQTAGVYRLPCQNCSAAMPFYDIVPARYNLMLAGIPDQQFQAT